MCLTFGQGGDILEHLRPGHLRVCIDGNDLRFVVGITQNDWYLRDLLSDGLLGPGCLLDEAKFVKIGKGISSVEGSVGNVVSAVVTLIYRKTREPSPCGKEYCLVISTNSHLCA